MSRSFTLAEGPGFNVVADGNAVGLYMQSASHPNGTNWQCTFDKNKPVAVQSPVITKRTGGKGKFHSTRYIKNGHLSRISPGGMTRPDRIYHDGKKHIKAAL